MLQTWYFGGPDLLICRELTSLPLIPFLLPHHDYDDFYQRNQLCILSEAPIPLHKNIP